MVAARNLMIHDQGLKQRLNQVASKYGGGKHGDVLCLVASHVKIYITFD